MNFHGGGSVVDRRKPQRGMAAPGGYFTCHGWTCRKASGVVNRDRFPRGLCFSFKVRERSARASQSIHEIMIDKMII